MKNIAPLSFILLVFSYSCSENKVSSEKNPDGFSNKKIHIVVQTSDVKADKVLNANIDGMVCEKGCGSSIRKELLNTHAVESCEFDFQNDRKTNLVKIAFDQDKITVDRIISILNAMNEKQFKVIDTSTSDFESKNNVKESKVKEIETSANTTPEMKEEVDVLPKSIESEETGGGSMETPNLLQIFSRLITG